MGKEHKKEHLAVKLKVNMTKYKSACPKNGNIIVQQTDSAFDHYFCISRLLRGCFIELGPAPWTELNNFNS